MKRGEERGREEKKSARREENISEGIETKTSFFIREKENPSSPLPLPLTDGEK